MTPGQITYTLNLLKKTPFHHLRGVVHPNAPLLHAVSAPTSFPNTYIPPVAETFLAMVSPSNARPAERLTPQKRALQKAEDWNLRGH